MNDSEIMERTDRVFMATYRRQEVVFHRGEGHYLFDGQGRRYLDFLGGLSVAIIGHAHPRVVEAIREQAGKLMHVSNLYYTQPMLELAELLSQISGGKKVFLCNSGAEANEGAIKLARRYAHLKRGPEASEILSLEHSFHGRTLATLAATGQERYRHGFEPIPSGFSQLPLNDLAALRQGAGPETAGFMVEVVQGEGGVNILDTVYLRAAVRLSRERGFLLISDEVQCGLGRTGNLMAAEGVGVKPDIITLAKGLGGGLPIGAVLAEPEVADAFSPGDHASTFGGNPVVAAAAVATLRVILEEELPMRAAVVGNYLAAGLQALSFRYPITGGDDVRGTGLILGLRIRDDRAPEVMAEALQRGLVVGVAGPGVLRLLPPLTISDEEVNTALGVLEEAVAAVDKRWRAEGGRTPEAIAPVEKRWRVEGGKPEA